MPANPHQPPYSTAESRIRFDIGSSPYAPTWATRDHPSPPMQSFPLAGNQSPFHYGEGPAMGHTSTAGSHSSGVLRSPAAQHPRNFPELHVNTAAFAAHPRQHRSDEPFRDDHIRASASPGSMLYTPASSESLSPAGNDFSPLNFSAPGASNQACI